MNIQNTQRKELAHKTKLTAVSYCYSGNKQYAFIMCLHDANGEAILPVRAFEQLADRVGATRRGDTVSIG